MALKSSRRKFALLLLVVVGTLTPFGFLGCKKNETPRCGRCGMMIEPQSAFRAELNMTDTGGTQAFDTVKCALKHRATRKVRTTLRVQEYYSRAWVDGDSVRYVIGSDVLGPMGKDIIPVAEPQVAKFNHDHGGDKTLKLAEIDEPTLNAVP